VKRGVRREGAELLGLNAAGSPSFHLVYTVLLPPKPSQASFASVRVDQSNGRMSWKPVRPANFLRSSDDEVAFFVIPEVGSAELANQVALRASEVCCFVDGRGCLGEEDGVLFRHSLGAFRGGFGKILVTLHG